MLSPASQDIPWTRQAVEFSPDGVLVVDAAGTMVFTNAALQTLWGSQESLVGRSVEELVPDAVRSRHAALRASYAEAPTTLEYNPRS